MMVVLLSNPLPFGTPSVSVTWPTWQPRLLGHVPLLVCVAVKAFLLVGANTCQTHIGAPFISCHSCNKISENSHMPGPEKCREIFFFMAHKTGLDCDSLWHIATMFGFSMNTNDQACSFQLYHNGSEVWYFTAWYNIARACEGITTQCKSIFLNLATGDTLEWYLGMSGSVTMTIRGGNSNSGNTTTPSELLQDIPLHNQGQVTFICSTSLVFGDSL